MEILKNLQLIKILTFANLKSRYRNTFYGFLWVLINPILTYAVQVFAFTTIFQVNTVNYPLYLLAGLFPWLFIQQSIDMCTGIFIHNGNIVKNIPIPPMILVLVQILDNFINFISAYLIIILYFSIFHSLNIFTAIYILLPTIPLLVAVTSMCLVFSLYNVKFRDLKFMVTFVFSLLFYLTPIFYNIRLVPEKLKFIISNNPIYYLIRPFQEILLANEIRQISYSLLYSFSFSILLLFLAYLSWKKMRKYLVFYV